MYAALEVHTDKTIEAGEREILNFCSLLKASLSFHYLLLLRLISRWYRNISMQRVMNQSRKIGTFQSFTLWYISLKISGPKALQETTTRNQTRSYMGLSKRHTACAPISRMSQARSVMIACCPVNYWHQLFIDPESRSLLLCVQPHSTKNRWAGRLQQNS